MLEVRDTGIGISAETLRHMKSSDFSNEGVGFFNVKKRISKWRGASLDVQSTEGVGTSVIIKVMDIAI